MILKAPEWCSVPPAPARGGLQRERWAAIVTELRSRPGEWARIATYEQGNSLPPAASKLRTEFGLEVVIRGLSLYACCPTAGK